ncbi:MAG: tRNA 4-thiouridine(8) synthase ThiI [Deltaproteobacteria bacterium]|nr:tRNA 4-thiouridine(8) synthase ThiI [Deltaproteobacteria bacterium]
MNLHPKKVRALGLGSGGLDSILSAVLLRKQGIEVEWISFETPFFSSEGARKASQLMGIPLTVQNITDEYLKMLKNPAGGYGKNMNPCMDCHALMFRRAGVVMKEKGFDLLFSGEVVGQRLKSQTKPSLRYVEKHSGFDGYILRPLSAKRLPETIPEKEGWVKRDLLLDISGKSRKPQIKLAEEFGIRDYPAPAGGCLLTDKNYAVRLKALFDHQDDYTESELLLLKYGRHLRLDGDTKIIVGRTRSDNVNILKLDTLIKLKNFPGPVVIIPHGGNENMIKLAASIGVGYSKAPDNTPVDVLIKGPGGGKIIQVLGLSPQEFKHFML